MPPTTLGAQVKSQMNRLGIHDVWEATYRTAGNERLFEQCYDYIVDTLAQPKGSKALDVGCGICANSLRLARRGYLVDACDCSEPILERARRNVSSQGLADRIDICCQDITALEFEDASFDLTLCWGVLMHVPDLDEALSELVRVTKSGGYLVMEEVNLTSPEAFLSRLYWRGLNLVREKKIRQVATPAGVDCTVDFRGEKLFWRQIRLFWMIDQMALRGCRLIDRRAGMFTEAHRALPSALRRPVDAWNRFYQGAVGLTSLAKHSILIFARD